AEGAVEAADLIDGVAGDVEHRSARAVEDAVSAVPPDLADLPMVRGRLKLELEMRRRRGHVGYPPIGRGREGVVVKQKEVLNAALVQKLDALVLRGGSPPAMPEAVELPARRAGDRPRG